EVLRVAIAADKYDCVVALRFAGESWSNPKDIENTVDLGRLMIAAYIFDSARTFEETTRALIFLHVGSY
ncbi:hypothetical protein AOQ84DRAFT_278792, partial [Glonium stellatum]